MLTIVLKNVLVNGDKRYILEDVRAYTKKELPVEYLRGPGPHFYLWDDGQRMTLYRDGRKREYVIGEVLTREEVSTFEDIARDAGARLHKIKNRIRKLEKEWVGKRWKIEV